VTGRKSLASGRVGSGPPEWGLTAGERPLGCGFALDLLDQTGGEIAEGLGAELETAGDSAWVE